MTVVVVPASQRAAGPSKVRAPRCARQHTMGGRAARPGLGLLIVAAVAELHEAMLEVSATPEGGISVAVRFPAEPAAPA